MLVTKQDLDKPYTVIGTVHGYSVEEAQGCSGKLNVIKAFERAETSMRNAAEASGADAVVGLSFQQRDTRTSGCSSAGRPASEVYATGTAVKFT